MEIERPKATPAEMTDTIVAQLESIEQMLDYLTIVDTPEITSATGRINRRLPR